MDSSRDELTAQRRKAQLQTTSLDSLDLHPNDSITFLLDGASPQMPFVAPELETQRRVAGQIYLKFEGGNPTGTQKDRIAFAQVMDAMRRGFDAITVATCGNYGVALALAASMAGLKCLIYIPEGYHTKRVQEMTDLGAKIVRAAGDYEQAVITSRQHAEAEEIYDANPGGANTALQLKVYGEIAYEIYDELRDAPAAVAVPVSNGSTLVGIYKGFLSLYRRGKTSRLPRMVAGSSHGKFAKPPLMSL
jgi:threonine synthase